MILPNWTLSGVQIVVPKEYAIVLFCYTCLGLFSCLYHFVAILALGLSVVCDGVAVLNVLLERKHPAWPSAISVNGVRCFCVDT
jgi:hypothetical protein